MTNDNCCILEVLPHHHQIKASVGDNLLELLFENSILLRSDCGGKGVCGKCRIEIVQDGNSTSMTEACTCTIDTDMLIQIPESSRIKANCIRKTHTRFPASFAERFSPEKRSAVTPGLAIDLGTTTIAIYLCDTSTGFVLSSLAIKNPQSLYGDDVMSRICKISETVGKLTALQKLVTGAIEFGCRELLINNSLATDSIGPIAIVGNPTMIHILLGVDPRSIGVAPYLPLFYDAKSTNAVDIGMQLTGTMITTLPQMSGFLGGDILSAALAVDLASMPDGTLLIDLGTNGELLLKSANSYFGTSCATGPAFEGASLSCGMQAADGAIDRIWLEGSCKAAGYSLITSEGQESSPRGICGSGIISGIAAFTRGGILEKNGSFTKNAGISALQRSLENGRRYIIVPGKHGSQSEIAISQKDVRAVQLGKAALITGIEFLMKAAGIGAPKQILVAGAFGSHIAPLDLLTLGMIPAIELDHIKTVGNAAGTGAIMTLCDNRYVADAKKLAAKIKVIDLAADRDFQNDFIDNLHF